MDTIKNYLLIDAPETLDYMRKGGMLRLPNIEIVSLYKRASIACEKKGIDYRVIDEFSSIDNVIDFTYNNYEKLLQFCSRFDSFLKERLPDLMNRGIEPFKYSYYHLKILMDSVSVKVFQTYHFLKTAEGARVFYRDEVFDGAIPENLFYPELLNLFPAILNEISTQGDFKIDLLPLAIPRGHNLEAKNLYFSCKATVSKTYQFLKSTVRKFSPIFRKTGSSYVHFALGYDIKYIIPKLRKAGIFPESLPDFKSSSELPQLKQHCDELWGLLLRDDDFINFFSVNNINYFPIIASRMRLLITQLMPKAIYAYDEAIRYLSKTKRKRLFAITAYVTVGIVERSKMKACQDRGLSLITYQEGAGFGSVDHPMNDYAEVRDGDIFLCYGEGNMQYYQDRNMPVKRFIPVGSAYQDRIRLNIINNSVPSKISTIMYISTISFANSQHHPYNAFTDTWYFKKQLRIFNCLNEIATETKVIIKLHPHDSFAAGYLVSRKYKFLDIRMKKLENMLEGIDLFIIDFPSTVFLNCCSTGSHIFVLAEKGITKFSREQLLRIEKRASVFFDFASFEKKLKEFIDNPDKIETRNDQEYILKYGTYLGDGNSANRAVQYLQQGNF